jgi:hypothetical protein
MTPARELGPVHAPHAPGPAQPSSCVRLGRLCERARARIPAIHRHLRRGVYEQRRMRNGEALVSSSRRQPAAAQATAEAQT